jgi:hypothetical protein
MEAIRLTMAVTASSRMNTEATPTPAPLSSGASEPSRPQATTKETTLITVAQTQPRRRCISRTVAATAGSDSVAAESGDFTGLA